MYILIEDEKIVMASNRKKQKDMIQRKPFTAEENMLISLWAKSDDKWNLDSSSVASIEIEDNEWKKTSLTLKEYLEANPKIHSKIKAEKIISSLWAEDKQDAIIKQINLMNAELVKVTWVSEGFKDGVKAINEILSK